MKETTTKEGTMDRVDDHDHEDENDELNKRNDPLYSYRAPFRTRNGRGPVFIYSSRLLANRSWKRVWKVIMWLMSDTNTYECIFKCWVENVDLYIVYIHSIS